MPGEHCRLGEVHLPLRQPARRGLRPLGRPRRTRKPRRATFSRRVGKATARTPRLAFEGQRHVLVEDVVLQLVVQAVVRWLELVPRSSARPFYRQVVTAYSVHELSAEALLELVNAPQGAALVQVLRLGHAHHVVVRQAAAFYLADGFVPLDEDQYAVVRFVREHFRKTSETEFFELYE